MTDYVFSKMPKLLANMNDDMWFRYESLITRKSFNLHLSISVYRSGKYFLIIKGINIGDSIQHYTASILLKDINYYNDHKISFTAKDMSEAETILKEKILLLKTKSYYGSIHNTSKKILDFNNVFISTNPMIEIKA
jgi:hypothetical protein